MTGGHRVSCHLSRNLRQKCKADSFGAHQLKGSLLAESYFQYGTEAGNSRVESDLLGRTEACAAHRCTRWISLANEQNTYLQGIDQSPALRAARV